MTRYRWCAEFIAGPGGFCAKEEIASDWFSSPQEAKRDALENAEKEVGEFPYSRRRILRLFVEDDSGTVTEVSTTSKDNK